VFDKAWKPLGITRSQWWLLINLSQQDGTSQRSLAIKMNMSQVSVGESLILLEKSGFVVRTPDMVDRRQKIIFITDEGYELLERSRQISGYLNTAIMRGIPAEDVAVTERTLQRMRENLVELEA
jgi:DNA-binding MarR family transcriptional regulator